MSLGSIKQLYINLNHHSSDRFQNNIQLLVTISLFIFDIYVIDVMQRNEE